MSQDDVYAFIEGLPGLREIYDEITRETSAFAEAAGITCPETCGKCCNTPSENIEASVFEMMIPAIELWKNGKAYAILDRLTSLHPESVCVLFVPGETRDKGRCSHYSFRGLICRLFGFAGCIDKYNKIRFSPCIKMKNDMPEKEAEIRASIGKGLHVPVLSAYRQRIFDLNPLLASDLYPINTALSIAIQKIGFYFCRGNASSFSIRTE